MKFRVSIPIVLTTLLLGLFVISSSSCSSKKGYSSGNKISYNRSSRIKTYKAPSNRNSYAHGSSVRKKYVIKK